MENLRAAGLSEMEIMEALMESKRRNKREKRASRPNAYGSDIGRMTQALHQMNMRQDSSSRTGGVVIRPSDSLLSTRPKEPPPPRKILSQAEREAAWRAEVAAISATIAPSREQKPVETKSSENEDLLAEAKALGISLYELKQQKSLLERYKKREGPHSYVAGSTGILSIIWVILYWLSNSSLIL